MRGFMANIVHSTMEFDLQPTLRGNLLQARPLVASDFDALYAAASDPLIWEQHPEPHRYTKPTFQKFFDSAMESRGAFAVTDLASGKVIGSSRYYGHDPGKGSILIGYTFLERAYWGRSYNSELKNMMINHAFKFVEHVYFEVGENNTRSRIALERIGARFVGQTQIPLFDGSMHPTVVFVIDRDSRRSPTIVMS
jgi:RimJ/RimL family protein N-acetyltransferase